MTSPVHIITLRVTPELRERLYLHKNWKGMSVNGAAISLLEQALNQEEILRMADRKRKVQP